MSLLTINGAKIYDNVDAYLQAKGLYNFYPGEMPMTLPTDKARIFAPFHHALVMIIFHAWWLTNVHESPKIPEKLAHVMADRTLSIMDSSIFASGIDNDLNSYSNYIMTYTDALVKVVNEQIEVGNYVTANADTLLLQLLEGRTRIFETVELEVDFVVNPVEEEDFKTLVRVHSPFDIYKLIIGLNSPKLTNEQVII